MPILSESNRPPASIADGVRFKLPKLLQRGASRRRCKGETSSKEGRHSRSNHRRGSKSSLSLSSLDLTSGSLQLDLSATSLAFWEEHQGCDDENEEVIRESPSDPEDSTGSVPLWDLESTGASDGSSQHSSCCCSSVRSNNIGSNIDDDEPLSFLQCPKSSLKVKTQTESLLFQYRCRAVTNSKYVRWSKIHQVQTHSLILGDNPAARDGPPIALGWKVVSRTTLHLDDDDDGNGQPQHANGMMMPMPRRLSTAVAAADDSLHIPGFQREQWLRRAGYSRREVAAAVKLVRHVQHLRQKNTQDPWIVQMWKKQIDQWEKRRVRR